MDLIFDGQADERHFEVTDNSGSPCNISEVVCPILKLIDEMTWGFIGTGFFITTNGLFATAKHVLLDALDKESNQIQLLYIVQWLPDGTYIIRDIQYIVVHSLMDVGIGSVRPRINAHAGEPLLSKRLILTAEQPTLGESIFTFAYPITIVHHDPQPKIFFNPRYYLGRLEEYYPNGPDRVILPFPCYRTSIWLHGGGSGGPVIDSHGRVFAINSASFGGVPDISFVSRIVDILGLTLPSVSIENSPSAPMLIFELARQGHLSFRPPLSHCLLNLSTPIFDA
jgi:Trypsin-like peptidase domain